MKLKMLQCVVKVLN